MFNQLIMNALIAGSVYALVGVGFALLFRVLRFFHFTHGLSYTLGAYAALGLSRWSGLSWFVVIPMALVIAVLVGLMLDRAVYAPLRSRSASSLVCLLASIGLYIVGQNAVSLIFGDSTQSIRPYLVERGLHLWGARITGVQSVIIGCSITACVVTALWLRLTSTGRQVRAVANDPELAAIVGVPTRRIIAIVTATGWALGAFAGILASFDRDMVPTMGMHALLMGIVAVIVGGANSIGGVFFGAILIAAAQNLSALWIPLAWQDAIVFLILVVFLLVRPQGVLGRSLRGVEV